jgi:hypothetical protein
MTLPTAPVAAAVLARRQWLDLVGLTGMAPLAAVCLGWFGLSHPLAKRMGPWPAVLTAARARPRR